MTDRKHTRLARRLMRNAMVVIAATAIFGFKTAERGAVQAAAPLQVASR